MRFLIPPRQRMSKSHLCPQSPLTVQILSLPRRLHLRVLESCTRQAPESHLTFRPVILSRHRNRAATTSMAQRTRKTRLALLPMSTDRPGRARISTHSKNGWRRAEARIHQGVTISTMHCPIVKCPSLSLQIIITNMVTARNPKFERLRSSQSLEQAIPPDEGECQRLFRRRICRPCTAQRECLTWLHPLPPGIRIPSAIDNLKGLLQAIISMVRRAIVDKGTSRTSVHPERSLFVTTSPPTAT